MSNYGHSTWTRHEKSLSMFYFPVDQVSCDSSRTVGYLELTGHNEIFLN